MIGEKGADHIRGKGMLKPSDVESYTADGWQQRQREKHPERKVDQ